MEPILAILFGLAAAGGVALWLLKLARKRRASQQQVTFIRETLASSGKADHCRIIASLSTLPDRITNLRPTLECLANQTRPPDEIVLALPAVSARQQRPYLTPEYLRDYPLLRILNVERDWGPATKSIPVVRDELAAGRAETLIMVVDDDRLYAPDAVETYLHFNRQLPDAALCFRGAAMPPSFDWRRAKMLHGDQLREPEPVAVITGCGSYLIQPRFFDDAFWDYSHAPRAAFFMDDIWISGCLDRRRIKKYVVPGSMKLRSVKAQDRAMSLHDVPQGRQANNNELIQFFRPTWDVFPSSDLGRNEAAPDCG